MDPSSLSNLDPKLKETYEKVMGTNTNSLQGQTPPPPADGQIPQQENVQQQPDASAEQSAGAQNNTQANPDQGDGLSAPVQSPPAEDPTQQEQPQTVTINQSPANPQEQANQSNQSNIIAPKPSGHGGLLKVFYILGGTVFFVIYIFFWMKIFNFQMPF